MGHTEIAWYGTNKPWDLGLGLGYDFTPPSDWEETTDTLSLYGMTWGVQRQEA